MSKKSEGFYDPYSNSTYEQQSALKKAHNSTKQHPDRVRYDPDFSYRDKPYRLLGHQNGIIGFITLRLLQGRGLKRSRNDWSLMALGPMKHLPLSNKHGEVRSSFCTFRLMHADREEVKKGKAFNSQDLTYDDLCQGEEFRSSVVSNSNDPVWADNRSGSHFVIPLKKGNLPDGVPVRILTRVLEPHTAVESLLPSQVKGGSQPLGQAVIDVTDLCFGETVRDTWIDLSSPNQDVGLMNEDTNDSNGEEIKSTGKLRILISYEPCGIEPKEDDTVCFEAFARNVNNLIIPSQSPMKVVNREGGYILVKYRMPNGSFGSIRLHRNSIFVIERLNAIDGAIDFALTPTDIFFSSELGQQVAHHVSPVVKVVGDFVKPAVLTGQLLTTVGISGISTTAKLVLATMGQNVKDSNPHNMSHEVSL